MICTNEPTAEGIFRQVLIISSRKYFLLGNPKAHLKCDLLDKRNVNIQGAVEVNLEKLLKALDICSKLLCANKINSMDLKLTANDS